MAVLTILFLPIHDHRSSFYLLVSFSISFFNILSFYYMSLSLAYLELSQDSLFFWGYCEWWFFPDFFWVYLSFVYSRATDFFVLILYPTTLLLVLCRSADIDYIGMVLRNFNFILGVIKTIKAGVIKWRFTWV